MEEAKYKPKTTALKPYALTQVADWPTGYHAYLKDESNGMCYILPYGEWVIGRKDEDEEIDIPIVTDEKYMPYMSRHHAIVKVERNLIGENSVYIRDFEYTTNHTYVDRIPMDATFNYQLFDGDIVRMGLTYFTVHIRLKRKGN